MRNQQEQEWIVIRGVGSVSGLGFSRQEVRDSLASGKTAFTTLPSLGADISVSPISISAEEALTALKKENPVYATLDRSVQLAILAARQAIAETGWSSEDVETMGVNMGSSRGATGLFEQYHREFLANPESRLSPAASPSTTLGNVASWVAQDLQASGPVISHSVTCSTAIQAIANGVAWLRSGMAKRFLVGGTEAPLTPFTLAQMKAIGIYSKLEPNDNPCRPLNQDGLNTFVLGEGAAVFALERMAGAELANLRKPCVVIEAVGLGFEKAPSKTGITPEGQHFQKAMEAALGQARLNPQDIDGCFLHAPGTRAGDRAELAAVRTIFQDNIPPLLSIKHLVGHTLGASGALAVMAGVEFLKGTSGASLTMSECQLPLKSTFERVLINAAGFGGNCASILLQHLR